MAMDALALLQASLTAILSNLTTVLPAVTDLDVHIDVLLQRAQQCLQRTRGNAVLAAEIARLTSKVPQAVVGKVVQKQRT